MGLIKNVNLLCAFLLELCLLVIFGYWGYTGSQIFVIKIGYAFGLVIIISGLWGLFFAPKATRRFRPPFLFIAKLILFSLGALVLWSLGETILSVIFWLLSVINTSLLYIWRQ